MSTKFKKIIALSGKLILLYVVLAFISFCICGVGIAVSMLLLSKAEGAGGGGHANGIGAILVIFVTFISNPKAGFLFILSVLVFPIIYYVLINKYAVRKGVYYISKGGALEWLLSKLRTYFGFLENKQPGWLKKISNAVMLKAKIYSAIAEDKNSSWLQRRLLKTSFSLVKLDDIDFKNENLAFTDIVIDKTKSTLTHFIEPSVRWLFIAYATHVGIMVFLFWF